MINTRIDFVFSYWIFAWYLLYEFKIVNDNPKIALTIALIENFIGLFLMIYYSNSKNHILSFIIIMTLIKIIPLWRLRNTDYEFNSLYIMISLFMIFLLWLSINKIDIIEYHKGKLDSVKKDKPFGPFMDFFDKN